MKVHLSLTEDCNFNCSYCYMKLQKGTRIDLSEKNIKGLIDTFNQLFEHYNGDLRLILIGGEPLLYWDDVVKAVNITNNLPFLSKIIITNGYLLNKEKKQFLKDNNIQIVWSFDGLWTAPSKIKFYQENKKLFSDQKLCKCVINADNITEITDNFLYLVDDFNIINPEMFLSKDNNYTETSINNLDIELEKFSEKYLEKIKEGIICSLYDSIIEKYIRKLDNIESCTSKKETNFLSFCTNGKIYPCIRFFHKNMYDNLGDWKKGFLDFNVIHNLKSDEIIQNCNNCYLNNICPKQCLEIVAENNNKLDQNLCKIFKVLIKHALNFYKNNQQLYNERYKL